MNQAIIDHYRGPAEMVDLQLAGPLSEDPSYCHFGPETICYGDSWSGVRSKRVSGALYDTLGDITTDDGTVYIPFDPDELLQNPDHEPYRADGDRGSTWLGDHPTLRSLYYGIRPFLFTPIRKHLQRAYLRNWTRIRFPKWPVDRTVVRLLERLLVLSMTARGIHRVPFVWFWPRGAPASAFMSHDVEQRAGRNLCSQLMDMDASVGINASFQIVPEQPTENSRGGRRGLMRREGSMADPEWVASLPEGRGIRARVWMPFLLAATGSVIGVNFSDYRNAQFGNMTHFSSLAL